MDIPHLFPQGRYGFQGFQSYVINHPKSHFPRKVLLVTGSMFPLEFLVIFLCWFSSSFQSLGIEGVGQTDLSSLNPMGVVKEHWELPFYLD